MSLPIPGAAAAFGATAASGGGGQSTFVPDGFMTPAMAAYIGRGPDPDNPPGDKFKGDLHPTQIYFQLANYNQQTAEQIIQALLGNGY